MIRNRAFFHTKLGYSENIWNTLNYLPFNKKETPVWTSATNTKNYLINDPLLDWLDLYYCQLGLNVKGEKIDKYKLKKKSEENLTYLNILFQKGFEFEDKIINELKHKFNGEVISINNDGRDGRTQKNFNLTKDAIFDGVPIISQAVLFNENNFTMGCADLLVRSDYINKITKIPSITDKEVEINAPNLKKYHYRVVDIKWTSLPFMSKKTSLRKEGFIPAYKGQLSVYNCALGNIQGYFPKDAYLLGKGWNQNENGEKVKIYDCFDRLGTIDYSGVDVQYIENTVSAIKWFRDVQIYGKQWCPLDRPEKKNQNMFMNMSNDDMKWGNVKKEIIGKMKENFIEPTMISYVGVNERRLLYEKKIYSITDPRFNSKNMGMKPSLNSEKVDTICNINRDLANVILPKKIQNNDELWQTIYPTDMYFDYESINADFVKKNIDIHNSETDIFVFMIGVGYIQNEVWNYKTFYINEVNDREERRIMEEFIEFVTKKSSELDPSKKYSRRLFHWSQAEISNLKNINKKNGNIWDKWIENTKFIDMYRVFNQEKIGIKGAYTYSLKSIGNALYKLNCIKSTWPDNNIANGQISLFAASQYYREKENKENKKVFQQIIDYNEIDCKMIWEIVEFLRKL